MVNLFSMKDYTKSVKGRAQKAFTLFLVLLLFAGLLLGGASSKPVQAQATTYPEYVVKPGDSLLWIAAKFNTTLEAIMSVNQLGPENTLHPGDKIKIPSLAGMQGILSSEYVGLGTSLISLSRRSQAELSQLIRLNRITSPSELFIGREILMTDVDQESPTAPNTLLEGQSFLEMAIKSNVNPWSLGRRNLLQNANHAIPQDSFYVPSSVAQLDALAIPGVGSISIGNLPLRQGDTYYLSVESPGKVQVKSELLDFSPQFTDIGDGKQIAYVGIHALTEPGVYPLSMSFTRDDGFEYRFDQLVVIKSGNYATDRPLKVDPATLDGDNIRAEDAIFRSLLAPVTPVQHWDGLFYSPAQDADCVISTFGSRRTYNDDPKIFYHTGLDLGYCKGTDVYAPAVGKVVGALPGLIVRGNTIIIDHGLGVYTIYMHLEEILVEEGAVVERGQLIGVIGTTGRSTGPHLHFEVDIQGTPVNPATWLRRAFP